MPVDKVRGSCGPHLPASFTRNTSREALYGCFDEVTNLDLGPEALPGLPPAGSRGLILTASQAGQSLPGSSANWLTAPHSA